MPADTLGELLDEAGELTLKNIQLSGKNKTTPLQRVEYTCREGLNEYKTAFAIFGFQYVEVEADFEIATEAFTAIAVYSDMEETRKNREPVEYTYSSLIEKGEFEDGREIGCCS